MSTPGTAPNGASFQIAPIRSESRLVEAESVLQECFELPLNRSFFEDFPVWDPSLKLDVRRLGAFDENGNLASLAMSRRAMVRIEGAPSGELPITLIGGVCTLQEFRGFGLATRLVEELLHGARESGSAFSVLWGSEHELYGRIGFELFGEQWRIPVSAVIANPHPVQAAVQTGFTEGIFRKRLLQRNGVALVSDDIRWMKRHRHVEWYWTGARENPTAYAAIHRGIDLKDLVHEWGGDPLALATILKTIYWQNRASQLLGSPRQVTELLLALGSGRLLTENTLLIREGLALVAFHDEETKEFLKAAPDRLWFWGLDGA